LTHRAAEPLAVYHLPHDIACQFGGHLHRNGYAVKTCCGRTFHMGSICGSQQIIGLPAMVAAHVAAKKRKDEYLQRKEVLRNEPTEEAKLLDGWLSFTEQADQMVRVLGQHGGGLLAELEDRSRDGARGREVLLRAGSQRRLEGIGIIDAVVRRKSLLRTRAQVQNLMERVRLSEPQIVDAEALYAEWRDLRRRSKALRKRLDDARKFLTQSNMQLLLDAARDARQASRHVPGNVRVEGTFYVFRYAGTELLAGVNPAVIPVNLR
jgi:hypothetical protein